MTKTRDHNLVTTSVSTHCVTVSRGPRTNARGQRHQLGPPTTEPSPVSALLELLRKLRPSEESWWSPHTWENNKRASKKWQAACGAVIDVDFRGLDGTHQAPSTDKSERLVRAASEGALPGNLFHVTPRGSRIVFLFTHPVSDPDLYAQAVRGAWTIVRAALETLELLATEEADRGAGDGYAVDKATIDLARVFYTPNSIVDGIERAASVLLTRSELQTAEQLAALAPSSTVANPEPASGGESRPGDEFAEAAARWNMDHSKDWGPPGSGECPACGHRGCFGRLAALPDRWACFSKSHERDARRCGRWTGAVWMGDALDLEALKRKVTRAELLRSDGYLRTHAEPRVTKAESKQTGTEQEVPTRPTIVVRKELADVTDEAERALLADPESGIYVRSRMLVRVSRAERQARAWLVTDPDAPFIDQISQAYLRERLDRAANWVSLRKNRADEGGEWEEIPALVPNWAAETILARGEWSFPSLMAVMETPTLRPDGTVIEQPGLDVATGILYRPSQAFPPVPREPSKADVVKAVTCLLDPLQDFPFDGEEFSSATIAAILSLVARRAFAGCVPMFAIRSPAGGTGKGMLADVISIVGAGRAPARMIMGRNEEETRKRILAIALNGAPAVLLDNVDRCLGSETLAVAITSELFEDRLLGATKMIRAPLQAVWLATGNGLTFRDTLDRRVVIVDLDAQREFPEDRTGFRYPNLLKHVREKRADLVIAALTILVAFHQAGRPSHGKTPMGSYEGWDAFVRAACIWVGLTDPCAGRERIRREDDDDREAARSLFGLWHEEFDDRPMTAAELKAFAEERASAAHGQEGALVRADLHAALAALDARGNGTTLNSRAIGDRLRQWKGKVVNGLKLSSDPVHKRHGAAIWQIKRTEGSREGPGSPNPPDPQ
jgi:hypothetical protein